MMNKNDRPKPFYIPSDIMANILSYLPTPLDHHKKQMKIVNQDFKFIKDCYYQKYINYEWYLDYKGCDRRGGIKIKRRWDMRIEDHRACEKGTYEYIP